MTAQKLQIDATLTVAGPAGISERVPLPDSAPNADITTCYYLITAPRYHPAWSQYALCVFDLTTERPGDPPVHYDFVGATHQLDVHAIDPTGGLLSPITLVQHTLGQRKREHGLYLQPTNIQHQFQATDQEMTDLAWLAGRGVVLGALNPETGDAPKRIREQWLASCVQTLAHFRGETHGDIDGR